MALLLSSLCAPAWYDESVPIIILLCCMFFCVTCASVSGEIVVSVILKTYSNSDKYLFLWCEIITECVIVLFVSDKWLVFLCTVCFSVVRWLGLCWRFWDLVWSVVDCNYFLYFLLNGYVKFKSYTLIFHRIVNVYRRYTDHQRQDWRSAMNVVCWWLLLLQYYSVLTAIFPGGPG